MSAAARAGATDHTHDRIALGTPRLHLRRTDSTNERARALASAGAPDGTLVTAGEQTAGRGRQGRSWAAPANSALLMSLVLRSAPRLLPLLAAVAVCEVAGKRARIKWPNDVVVEQPTPRHDDAPGAAGRPAHAHGAGAAGGAGRTDAAGRTDSTDLAKLAGILVEGRPQEGWAVLGIGVNVAVDLALLPADVRARAATMGGDSSNVEPALHSLLAALRRWLAEPAGEVLAAWRDRDALRGRAIAWGAPAAAGAGASSGGAGPAAGRGTAMGIDGDGRLVVALRGGGQTTLQAGEVHLERVGDGDLG